MLGSQISSALAELGARVVVASRDGEKCKLFAENLRERFPGAAHAGAALDITDKESVGKLMATLTSAGGLDVLVNCSWSGKKNTLDSISEEN